MKNPFRHETIRSPLPPEEMIARLRERTIPFESIFTLTAPLDGYKNFLKESFVGDNVVVAKIEDNHFRLMPIGFWPVKGKTPLANAGALFGRIEAEAEASRIVCFYRMPWLWIVFVSALFVLACLLSLFLTWVVVSNPQIDGRPVLIALIFGFPAFVMMFAAYGLVGAWQQARRLH